MFFLSYNQKNAHKKPFTYLRIQNPSPSPELRTCQCPENIISGAIVFQGGFKTGQHSIFCFLAVMKNQNTSCFAFSHYSPEARLPCEARIIVPAQYMPKNNAMCFFKYEVLFEADFTVWRPKILIVEKNRCPQHIIYICFSCSFPAFVVRIAVIACEVTTRGYLFKKFIILGDVPTQAKKSALCLIFFQ